MLKSFSLKFTSFSTKLIDVDTYKLGSFVHEKLNYLI